MIDIRLVREIAEVLGACFAPDKSWDHLTAEQRENFSNAAVNVIKTVIEFRSPEEQQEREIGIGMIEQLREKGWIICSPGALPVPRDIEEAKQMYALIDHYIDEY